MTTSDILKMTVDELDSQRTQLVLNFQGKEKSEDYYRRFELLTKLIQRKDGTEKEIR